MDKISTTNSKNNHSEINALIGALVGLARAMDSDYELAESYYPVMIEALYLLHSQAIHKNSELMEQIDKLHEAKNKLAPDCAVCSSPCGRTADYAMEEAEMNNGKIFEQKTTLLSLLCDIASRLYIAEKQGLRDKNAEKFVCQHIFYIGEYLSPTELEKHIEETRQALSKCENPI